MLQVNIRFVFLIFVHTQFLAAAQSQETEDLVQTGVKLLEENAELLRENERLRLTIVQLQDSLHSCEAQQSTCAVEPLRQVPARPNLRWRSKPYRQVVAQSPQSSPVYGGPYVIDLFKKHGFEGPVLDDDWDVLFSHHPQRDSLQLAALPSDSRIRLVHNCEYFTGAGQKCAFAKHMDNVKRQLSGNTSSGYLRTYQSRNASQVQELKRLIQEEPSKYWVLKPCTAGRSAGIELLQSEVISAMDPNNWSVVQEYIRQPYLLDGRKFHLRMYVLITRWHPVGAFLFDEGMLFLSKHKYSGSQPSVERDVFSAVSAEVDMVPHATLWNALDVATDAPSAAEVQARIYRLLGEVFGTAIEESFGDPSAVGSPGFKHGFPCFDLFGLDIMLDGQLTPHLLEINIGPNLWMDAVHPELEKHQRTVKYSLVEQIVKWAAAFVGTNPKTEAAARAIEDAALLNFSRIL